MKSNFSKGMLMTALITGTVLCSSAVAFAEELQEYSLDQMVVTATRTEKRDVEVPATTNVITEQEIKNRGYVSVFDAFRLLAFKAIPIPAVKAIMAALRVVPISAV